MLRVNLVPAASGAKRITNLRNHTSVVQHLQSDLRGRYRSLLLALTSVQNDARKVDAWCTRSAQHGVQPVPTGPSGALQLRKRPVSRQQGVAPPSVGRNSLCPTGATKKSHIDSALHVTFPLDPAFALDDDDLDWAACQGS